MGSQEAPLLPSPRPVQPRASVAKLLLGAFAVLLGGAVAALCGLGGALSQTVSNFRPSRLRLPRTCDVHPVRGFKHGVHLANRLALVRWVTLRVSVQVELCWQGSKAATTLQVAHTRKALDSRTTSDFLAGGIVLGPIMLDLGLHPMVAASTSLLLVGASSSSATIEFALADRLPLGWAVIMLALCVVASVIGVAGIGQYVRYSGRASVVVFLLVFVMAAGGIFTAVSDSSYVECGA